MNEVRNKRYFFDFNSKLLQEIIEDNSLNDHYDNVKVEGIGDLMKVLLNIDSLRRLGICIYLPADDDTNYSSLKILSSLGVDCGLWIEENMKIKDELFLDLASYYYASPAPHARIEPFEYIISHINDEMNIKPIDLYSSLIGTYNGQASFDILLNTYYNHFIELDMCSKCKAFRICCGCLENNFSECERTMNEVLEYIVIRTRFYNKNICQR